MNILYCDGACRNNGTENPIGAWAFIIEVDGSVYSYDTKIIVCNVTNNIAEYMAVLYGCYEAKRLGLKLDRVVSDSQLVIRQLMGEYKINKQELKDYHAAISRMSGGMDFEWRNRNDPMLKKCDEACNNAMDLYLDSL